MSKSWYKVVKLNEKQPKTSLSLQPKLLEKLGNEEVLKWVLCEVRLYTQFKGNSLFQIG